MSIATLIGLVAASCTTISFLPQAIKSWKTKSTKDVSLPMYTLMITGNILWLTYGIMIKDLPIILANSIAITFVFPILMLKIKHG